MYFHDIVFIQPKAGTGKDGTGSAPWHGQASLGVQVLPVSALSRSRCNTDPRRTLISCTTCSHTTTNLCLSLLFVNTAMHFRTAMHFQPWGAEGQGIKGCDHCLLIRMLTRSFMKPLAQAFCLQASSIAYTQPSTSLPMQLNTSRWSCKGDLQLFPAWRKRCGIIYAQVDRFLGKGSFCRVFLERASMPTGRLCRSCLRQRGESAVRIEPQSMTSRLQQECAPWSVSMCTIKHTKHPAAHDFCGARACPT